MKQQQTLTGCDTLREWLIAEGFRIAPDRSDGECNWYAYRPSGIPARECECNPFKPSQIVVMPFERDGRESVEVNVTGEFGGLWYQLKCYSLSPAELMGRMREIEASLIAAWNALEAR
jgi:hypothetical protein